MTEKLKLCPFCGGEVEMVGLNDHNPFFIICEKCGLEFGQDKDYLSYQVVEAWNRRAEVQDDLISRHSAIEFIENVPYIKEHPNLGTLFREWMTQVIAAQPMQKTGRWIHKERNVLINTGRVSYGENGAVQEKRWAKVKKPYCSECGWYEDSEYEATPYCPNCGAKMDCEVEE